MRRGGDTVASTPQIPSSSQNGRTACPDPTGPSRARYLRAADAVPPGHGHPAAAVPRRDLRRHARARAVGALRRDPAAALRARPPGRSPCSASSRASRSTSAPPASGSPASSPRTTRCCARSRSGERPTSPGSASSCCEEATTATVDRRTGIRPRPRPHLPRRPARRPAQPQDGPLLRRRPAAVRRRGCRVGAGPVAPPRRVGRRHGAARRRRVCRARRPGRAPRCPARGGAVGTARLRRGLPRPGDRRPRSADRERLSQNAVDVIHARYPARRTPLLDVGRSPTSTRREHAMARPLKPSEILAAFDRWGVPHSRGRRVADPLEPDGLVPARCLGLHAPPHRRRPQRLGEPQAHHRGDAPDLRGPLANFGVTDDGRIDIVAAGAANHAGGGDPASCGPCAGVLRRLPPAHDEGPHLARGRRRQRQVLRVGDLLRCGLGPDASTPCSTASSSCPPRPSSAPSTPSTARTSAGPASRASATRSGQTDKPDPRVDMSVDRDDIHWCLTPGRGGPPLVRPVSDRHPHHRQGGDHAHPRPAQEHRPRLDLRPHQPSLGPGPRSSPPSRSPSRRPGPTTVTVVTTLAPTASRSAAPRVTEPRRAAPPPSPPRRPGGVSASRCGRARPRSAAG